MDQLWVSVGSGLLIIATVALFWIPFCWLMLTYGDASDFNTRKH